MRLSATSCPPCDAPADTASPWSRLLASCRTAIGLSGQVYDHLVRGSQVSAFLPLLRNEVALAREIGRALAALEPVASTAALEQRRELTEEMRRLLVLEERNHRLLGSRGVKLMGPGAGFRRTHMNPVSRRGPRR